MLWRFFTLVFSLLLACLIGWWFAGDHGALIGVVPGALAWLALDSVRAARVLRWLREGDISDTPSVSGLWGEVVDRARRVLRLRDQQAQQSKQQLQDFLAAIQASPNGVVLLDPQGRIEWTNQTAALQFGFDVQRDMQQQVSNLVRDPSFGSYYASGAYEREIVIPGPGSTASVPVKLSVQLHPYGEGRKLLLSRDITAMEQAEIMRRDFVANVSHEIRTPLTVLAGFIETLQTLPLDAQERSRYLALMSQQASRMQTLVSDLLTLSRLEGSPLPGAGEWTALAVLMSQCEQEARALSATLGKSQEMTFSAPPPVEIAGTSHELLSAVSNLVSNAVRYTPSSGSVKVQWRALPDGRGELSVQDSGPGIAPEHISRLTERFYRVDRSRSRDTGGTGLGLAIVKHVAQRHGAELKIDSTVGVGSSFAIAFPANRLRYLPGADTSERPATESAAESG